MNETVLRGDPYSRKRSMRLRLSFDVYTYNIYIYYMYIHTLRNIHTTYCNTATKNNIHKYEIHILHYKDIKRYQPRLTTVLDLNYV